MIHFFENQSAILQYKRKAKFQLKTFQIKLAFADSIKSKNPYWRIFLLVPPQW
jgi:hypothetical protein